METETLAALWFMFFPNRMNTALFVSSGIPGRYPTDTRTVAALLP